MNRENSDEDLDQSMEEKPMKDVILPAPLKSGRPSTARMDTRPGSPKKKDLGAVEQSEESEEEEDDDEDEQGAQIEGAYNPADYEHLPVSAEIKELFLHIGRYSPQTIELEFRLKPFIPELIPAVGDIDAFIKVPNPSNEEDSYGLTVLDEPCAKQSDPAILDLQLRAVSKETNSKAVAVKTLEDVQKNKREIDNWINNISDLHRSKPAPAVHYTRNMPDIESLMQEWDPEFEELLKDVKLPSADLDCSLEQYVDVLCGLLDIPVYKSRIQSLHVLFTLYNSFKNHKHFQNMNNENGLDSQVVDGVDRLVL